jgi:predicted Zn-dependent protease
LGLREGIVGKKSFHFESFWPKLEGFNEAVQQSWDEQVICNCPLEKISNKLKRLTKALQSWSQKQVGNIKSQLAPADIFYIA